MYGFNIERIDLRNNTERQDVESFLSTFNLLLDEDVEVTFILKEVSASPYHMRYASGIAENPDNFENFENAKNSENSENSENPKNPDNFENVEYNSIIGTCSISGKVLKCFAVKPDFQGQGISGTLISSCVDYLFEKGIYEYFIYTLTEKKQFFIGFGLKEVISIKGITLLEGGTANIKKYINNMFLKSGMNSSEKAALVMNCNPFTLGHRYLVEKAAKENNEVVVFIVEENKSEFSFEDRMDLVKKGTADLENVKIISGGQYIISSATFPTYFLKEKDDKLKLYTAVDAGLFSEYIAPVFGIIRRYVGSEPYCEVTENYNSALIEILPKYNIELKLVDRLEIMNEAVSASRVRRLFKLKDWEQLKLLVPKTTFDYLYIKE